VDDGFDRRVIGAQAEFRQRCLSLVIRKPAAQVTKHAPRDMDCARSPAMKQYLARHAVRGHALVPGCGHGHELALAVEYGLDATGLDIAPTGVRRHAASIRIRRSAS